MVLSDSDIRDALARKKSIFLKDPELWSPLVIEPLDPDQIQPASVDLTLDDEFHWQGIERELTVMEEERGADYAPYLGIDLNNVADAYKTWPLETGRFGGFAIQPGQFVLGSTAERVEIPDDLCARVEGKSSLGRLGLLVHLTAGYIDPGFKGKITLEIVNLSKREIILRPGKPICQLSIIKLESRATHPYGHERLNSKYQDQLTTTGSRYDG